MSPETEHGFRAGLRAQLAQAGQELEGVREQLEQALVRERELRASLQHYLAAYERALEAERDQALRQTVLEHEALRMAGADAELTIRARELSAQAEAIAQERRELTVRRTELVAAKHELDLRDARTGAELDLREACLRQTLAEIERRERRVAARESGLAGYLGEAQQRLAS